MFINIDMLPYSVKHVNNRMAKYAEKTLLGGVYALSFPIKGKGLYSEERLIFRKGYVIIRKNLNL